MEQTEYPKHTRAVHVNNPPEVLTVNNDETNQILKRSLYIIEQNKFDVGWQPEILSPIARLPAGLYYSILSPQNMRAFQRTGSRIFSNEKQPQSHSISSILLNLPF